MTNRLPILALAGSILNINAALLPWGCQGSLSWSCRPGITFHAFPVVYVDDNGGVPFVLLSLLITALSVQAPFVARKRAVLAILLAALLLAAVIYRAGTWLFYGLQYAGWLVPAPAIALGLLLLGSSILLQGARMFYQSKGT